MILTTKITGAFLMTLTGLALITAQARADLQFNASSIANGTFTYNLNFNDSIDSRTGLPSQSLSAGNFATLYDIVGFSGATLNPAYSGLFTLTTPMLGSTAAGTAPFDDDALTNVTLTYNGAPITADKSFQNILSLTTTSNTTNPNGIFTGQTTVNVGAATGMSVGNIGSVSTPGISTNVTPTTPEPGSMAFLITAGLSGGAFAWRRRRSRK